MQIRHVTENDLKDLLELIRKGLGDEDAQEDFVRANLSKLPPEREAVFVADADGVAAGFRVAENWSKEKGCIGMRLNSGGTRHGAHEFYRSQGYNNEKTQIRFLKMY